MAAKTPPYLKSVDLIVRPKKTTPEYRQQMLKLAEAVESNKVVVVYALNPASFISTFQQFTPHQHFLVSRGNNFHYLVKWYSCCNLNPK